MILLEKTKEIIRRYWQRCQQFMSLIRRVISSIKNKYKQQILFILLLLFILLAPWASNFLMFKLFSTASFEPLYFSILCTFLFIIFYIYFVLAQKSAWLEKHQGFIVMLGILISIILFFRQQSLGEKDLLLKERDLFLKQTSFLKEDNERNNRHLSSVVNDIKNDPYVIFWRNFYTDNYKEYWSYISLNYSQDCKNLYADLTLSFDGLNNMIKTRNDLLIKPGFIQMSIEKLNTDIMSGASGANLVLNEIIGKCQQ